MTAKDKSVGVAPLSKKNSIRRLAGTTAIRNLIANLGSGEQKPMAKAPSCCAGSSCFGKSTLLSNGSTLKLSEQNQDWRGLVGTSRL